ncbi:hypothetical protein WN51_00809 [Melipona quadrifasciata]|uniref:Uncharacterized protein n=1 Tax=Melipona quadrifasciata TaxID=166423 RepID=A0A0N0BKP5_9HYME|nr:hypothetical protein WN51_00809 [Melipona quadrifasciata]
MFVVANRRGREKHFDFPEVGISERVLKREYKAKSHAKCWYDGDIYLIYDSTFKYRLYQANNKLIESHQKDKEKEEEDGAGQEKLNDEANK